MEFLNEIKGRLLALPANFRLTVANAKAYCDTELITTVKEFSFLLVIYNFEE